MFDLFGSKRQRKKISKAENTILERQKYKCARCGKPLKPEDTT